MGLDLPASLEKGIYCGSKGRQVCRVLGWGETTRLMRRTVDLGV